MGLSNWCRCFIDGNKTRILNYSRRYIYYIIIAIMGMIITNMLFRDCQTRKDADLVTAQVLATYDNYVCGTSKHPWVVITGGAGYIGSHAALFLLERNWNVIVVDDMSRGSNLALHELHKFRCFQFELLNIGNRHMLTRLFKQYNVYAVIHFASVAYVEESFHHKRLYFQNITENTKVLVDVMIEQQVGILIYSSTCAVYGIPQHVPITENTATNPISPYGQAKLDAENYIQSRSSQDFQVHVLRYFNVIGADPRGRLGENVHASVQSFGRLWTACVRTALGRQKYVSVHGSEFDTPDGTAIRDYLHVWDLVAAHETVLKRFPMPNAFVVSNLGTGQGTSTLQFIETFRKLTNIFIPVRFHVAKAGNPPVLFSNGGRLLHEGLWKPRYVDLSASLSTAWSYVLKHSTVPNPILETFDACIVGAGLSGAVLAERHVNVLGHKVLIMEKRDHIGGNCYDYMDEETGIRVSKYGVHLFHTSLKRVWDYVQNLSNWTTWHHRVLARVGEQLVPVPVNIDTVNILFNQNISNSHSMKVWLDTQRIMYGREPQNSEEMGLHRVGPALFNLLMKPYTMKQWEKDPRDLHPSVVGRIPVRTTHENRYFTDPFQALPSNGYTRIFENIFALPGVTVMLNTDFFNVRSNLKCRKIYYTGPIDAFFAQQGLEKLEYRSLTFDRKVFRNTRYFQPTSQVNYPSLQYNFTRIIEYKHLLHQKSAHTIVFYEYSSSHGEPYYPIPNTRNINLFNRYKELSSYQKNVSFVGRLANYKYFNMDQTIWNALELFDSELSNQVHAPVNSWADTRRIDSFYTSFKIPSNIVVPSNNFLWGDIDRYMRLALRKNVCAKTGATKTGKTFEGEFGFELTGNLRDVYRQTCLHGAIGYTASVVGMEPFYFFNLGKHKLDRSGGVQRLRARECTQQTATFPPTAHYFRSIAHIAVDKRFAVVHNKYKWEWKMPPVNFFAVSELTYIFDWIIAQRPDLSILYIWHKDRDLQDGFILSHEYDSLLQKYTEHVLVFDEIVRPVLNQTKMGDLPRKTLLNSLQLALLSRADIAFSVQGGLSHLITQVVPVVHMLHLKGSELNRPLISYACQSQHQGMNALIIYESRTALARRFQDNQLCNDNKTCALCDRFRICPCVVCN